MRLLPALLLPVLLLLAALPSAAETLDAGSARARLAHAGTLADVQIDGDLDLAGLAHPSGGTLSLFAVRLLGSLRNAPESPLEILDSELGAMRLSRARFRQPLSIERSRIDGRIGLEATRFEQGFSCLRCIVGGGVAARRARFDGTTDLAFSEFRGPVDFSAARFAAVSFDSAHFADPRGPVFIEADFTGPAIFSGIDTGTAPVVLVGASFRDQAVFRGCRIGQLVAAPPESGAASPLSNAVTAFTGQGDFRRCSFAHGADLRGVALRAGARFDGAAIGAGLLDLRGLTQTGELGIRGLRLGPDARVAADESSIGTLAADRAAFRPEAWRDLSPDALEALAARATALGAPAEGRALGFAAARARATAPDASWDDRTSFALQWLTQNTTDPLRPLLLAGLLWLAAILVVAGRGMLVRIRPEPGKVAPGLLSRVIEPIFRPMETDDLLARGGWCPRGRVHQVEAAASFACTLVFKLGSRQWRPAAAPGWRMAVLVPAWLAGFVLMALCGATLLRVVPELRDVATALPL